jgi:small subunit ribosomal protein S3Ae
LVTKKTKAKEWFTVIAPKIFNEREIGRTMAGDSGMLVGRRVAVSLIELTDNFDKFYMKFIFKVNKIEGNKAFADFDGSECMRDYISRMVIRRIRRIDTVQDLSTKDGVKIRVKGLAIIPRRIKNSIQIKVRNNIKENLKKEVETATLEEFVGKIISDETKARILAEARRIYPVRNFEIRKTEIITSAKAITSAKME